METTFGPLEHGSRKGALAAAKRWVGYVCAEGAAHKGSKRDLLDSLRDQDPDAESQTR